MRRVLRGAALTLGLAGGVSVAGAQQSVPPRAADSAHVLSLDDAMRLALGRSEVVRIAEAGVQRARGQRYQARSQYLPQLNGTAAYQRALQNQFNEIQQRFGDEPVGPQPEPLCNIPADSTGPERVGPCPAASGGFGAISQIFASENTVILGITGSQNLYTGGRVTAGYRAAQASERAAATGLAAQQAQLRYDVAQAYFDTQLANRLAVIAESSYVQAERALRQTSLGRQVGNISEFELLRARVTRDNVRPQVIQARTQRDVAMLRLRQLLDLPANAPLRLTTDIEEGVSLVPTDRLARAADPARPAATPAGTPVTTVAASRAALDVNIEELLADDSATLSVVDSVVARSDTAAEERANVRQAREAAEGMRQLLRVARGQRLPSVQLSTNYQRFSYPAGGVATSIADYYPNWTVTLGVSVPIFTGFRIRGDEMVAQADYVEAKEQLQQAREVAALDASLAIAELRQSQAAWNASLGTAEQASRAYTIADVRYREGISTQLELSESRVQLQQAMANRATAARNLQVARMRLALMRDLPFQLNGGSIGAGQSQAGAAQMQGGAPGGAPQQGRQAPRAGAQQAVSTGTSGTFQ